MKGFFNLISSEEFASFFPGFHPLEQEEVSLDRALGRVSGRAVTAPADLPPFARSTMDGFAVRARDTFGCSESEPALLSIQGEVAMGVPGASISLRPGQAARIWTGGSLPTNADSVVMVEYTRLLDETMVEVFRPVAPGENVIRAGEDYGCGETVLKTGHRLRPQDLGVLAGLGITAVQVHRRPRVAIISTGDELVEPDREPGPGQIRDINSTTLAGLVRESGATPQPLGIVRDDLDAMYDLCARAVQDADMVLLSGGSSVGRRDFTLQVLERLPGARLLAHGVAIRPGKPTILAQIGNKAVYGLPGHVASSMVVFYLLVRPLLRRYSGLPADPGLPRIQARTGEVIPSTAGREEYMRVRLSWQDSGQPPVATPAYGRSGLLSPLVRAHGLLVIGRDSEGLDKGELADVLLFP